MVTVNAQTERPHPHNSPLPGHEKPGLFNPGDTILNKPIGIRARVIPGAGTDILTCDLDVGGGFKPSTRLRVISSLVNVMV